MSIFTDNPLVDESSARDLNVKREGFRFHHVIKNTDKDPTADLGIKFLVNICLSLESMKNFFSN